MARRAVRGGERTRLLWHDNPLSVDRVALGATVFGCLLLAAVAVAGPRSFNASISDAID